MALTGEHQAEFERYAAEMLGAALGGDTDAMNEYAALGSVSAAGRLAKFKAWAAAERARETKLEVDDDTRIASAKVVRAARDTVLVEIEALTRF